MYIIYYSYTQVQGLFVISYMLVCLRIQKWIIIDCQVAYLYCCVSGADFILLQPTVGTYGTSILDLQVQGLFGAWTVLPGVSWSANSKIFYIRLSDSLFVLLCAKGGFPFLLRPGVCTIRTSIFFLTSKGYLVHGHYFHGYACLRIQKCIRFNCLVACIICCVPRTDSILLDHKVNTIRTPYFQPLGPRTFWYLGPTSMG